MSVDQFKPFDPAYASVPGDSLRETLDALHMTQADLAERAGLSTKHVNQIIQGVASITPETALALERVTGAPATFWTNLDTRYQLMRAREAEEADADKERDWVMGFPLPELEQRGIVSDRRNYRETRRELLTFFAVASRTSWERLWTAPEASFRRSRAYRVDDKATACWLRIGEVEAARTETAPFDATRFRQALTRIRRSMRAKPSAWEPMMRKSCAEAGVAIALVDEVKGSRANGAVRWLGPGKCLLQLSLRQRYEDIFWFSFFHECGHVLLHNRRDPVIESGPPGDDQEEQEADTFAGRMLIPDEDAARLPSLQSDAAIRAFAEELGIPPAIVVGRLQHDGLFPFSRGNHLRRTLTFVER